MSVKGIDVSKYQGNIDWQAVKNDGIQFAMIRAGYVTNGKMVVDERFHTNMAGALAAGMDAGVYLYSYATNEEQAKLEASLLLKEIEPYKGRVTYPIAWDIEDEKWQGGLSNATRTAMAKAFCEAIEAAGYYVSIYANLNWVQNKLNWAELTAYDLWLAQWAEAPTDKYAFGMWQYTSSGSVAGISGRVDMNEAYKDYPAIIRAAGLNGWGSNTPAPAPQPTPDPAPAPAPAPAERTYTVQPGDSFWRIAQEQMGNGSKYAELAAYNGLPVDAVIFAGQVLKIPGGGEASTPTMQVGAKVQYNGQLYGDSYGGNPGKHVSGTYTVSRIIEGRKCGVLVNDGLGWVPAGSCKVVG